MSFETRDGSIWLDGELCDWRDARIHVMTHAMHYGGAVFEGERAYNGTVFKMQEHHERLFNGARDMGMQSPWSVDDIHRAVMDTLKANNLTDAYVRPLIWRGAEDIKVGAPTSSIHLAIAAWAMPHYFTPERKAAGLKLMHARWKRPSPETAPSSIKASGLYQICSLSNNEAVAAGYDDALLVDYRGDISEATGANIFLIRDGELHTPDPHCILNGITRQTVIQLARDKGLTVHERRIPLDELDSFSEAFLTGTAYEVMPIQSIGETKFTPSDISFGLMQNYDDLVNGRA